METWFHQKGFQKGYSRPILRRAISDEFGSDYLGTVSLTEWEFRDFEYYGCREVAWRGVPICVLKLPLSWIRTGDLSEEWDWRSSRPSLSVILTKPSVNREQWKWTPAELLKQIRADCEDWLALPETGRTNKKMILYTCWRGEIEKYPSRQR